MKEGFSDILIMSSGRGQMTVRRALQKKLHMKQTFSVIYNGGPNIAAVTCVLDISVSGHVNSPKVV